ncbi:solute carrier family 22 member 17 [Acipenser ruthenus]|uniref:solute carrier family 22 member 17 n=1 Tax=Acipenser ruthenus TaxID=7906 RepID=UPI002740E61D|nr:solute carrier family 22 member 17 [Acipenser ruthenus]
MDVLIDPDSSSRPPSSVSAADFSPDSIAPAGADQDSPVPLPLGDAGSPLSLGGPESFGARHRLLVGLSCLPNIFVAFLCYSDSLMTALPNHHCFIDRASLPLALRNASLAQVLNASLPLEHDPRPAPGGRGGGEGGGWRPSQCQQFVFENGSRKGPLPCQQGWVYTKTEGLSENMVTQWDLVCDSYWKVPVEEVCFIVGILTGYLVLGYTADRFGRLQSFLCSLVLTVFFGVLVCVSPSPSLFILTRFFLGASVAGVYLSLYVMRLELCDPPRRLMGAMAAGMFTVAGQFLLLGVALGCQSWRSLQGAITVPLALFLSYGLPGVFPDSPRWFISSGGAQRAKDVLQSFTERREREGDEEVFTELDSVTLCESSPAASWDVSFLQLLRCRNIWKNICILGFTSFISHGIHHCYGTFGRDVRGDETGLYPSALLSAGTGGAACLFLCLTGDRFGRRGILLLTMTLTGIASLVLLGLIEYLNEAAVRTFSVLGMFSSHAAASLCVLFAAEIIPTVIRGLGVGVILSLGAVGRLSAPIMELPQRSGYFLHHVLYSSLALLCVLSIMLLPETKRKPLPQSLRDGELYRRPPLLRGRGRRDHVPLLCTPNPAI